MGLRGLWCDVFETAGHQVEQAATAGEARRILHTRACDVIILDLNLGSESGLTVATLATYANPDCKVIVTTGTPLFAQGELFDIAPSIASVLRKPVGIDDLLAVSEHAAA